MNARARSRVWTRAWLPALLLQASCATTGVGPGAAGPAGAPAGTVTVSAGGHDRQNTPVSFALPPSLAGAALELRDDKQAVLPIQVDAHGTARFILPALAKGGRAEFSLHLLPGGSQPGRGVTVARDKQSLTVSVDGLRVFSYRGEGALPSPDIDAAYQRGGYIHPVLTPSGLVVSDDYPKDHRHHHGIWTVWTSTEYEGRKPDFWNMGQKSGREDFVGFGDAWSGDVAGGFSTHHAAIDLGATPAKTVLEQDWAVTVWRTHAAPGGRPAPPYFLFDLEWTDRLVGSAPLVLPEYRYGGLGVRGAAEWKAKDAMAFVTSEGKDRDSGENTTARWYHLGGNVSGKPAGIAVLGHPTNFRAPQPVRINPTDPFFCVSPVKAGKMSIEPGKPYVSRYRFVVADGAPDKALLDRLWDDYADPPQVTFAAAPTAR